MKILVSALGANVQSKSYPQIVRETLPFAGLPSNLAQMLNDPKSKRLLARALLEVAAGFDKARVDSLVRVAIRYVVSLQSPGGQGAPAKRCTLDVPIGGLPDEVEAYSRLRHSLKLETNGKINGEAGAVCIAYWLNEHTHTSFVDYLKDGLLSEVACNDILMMASQNATDPKRGQRREGEEIEAGTMDIEQSRRGAKFKVVGTLEMSPIEEQFHRAQMGKYRESLARGDKFTRTPEQAISLIEQRIKALE